MNVNFLVSLLKNRQNLNVYVYTSCKVSFTGFFLLSRPLMYVGFSPLSIRCIIGLANLHRRHIDPLSICDTCGVRDETTFHALTECTYARGFWSRLKELTGVKLPELDPRTWTEQLLDDHFCKENDRGIILCGMWSIWRSRNDRRHGKIPIEMKQAVDWAMDVCFHLMHVRGDRSAAPREEVSRRWQKPPMDHLKINTDGAFCSKSGKGATGAVVRTDTGSFLLASARFLPRISSALAAEVEACRDGVRLAFTVTQGGVLLETDSLELVALWRHRKEQRSELTPVLRY